MTRKKEVKAGRTILSVAKDGQGCSCSFEGKTQASFEASLYKQLEADLERHFELRRQRES